MANHRLGGSGPLQKEKKIDFTSKPRTKKQKRLFDEITDRNIAASKGSAGEDGPSQVVMGEDMDEHRRKVLAAKHPAHVQSFSTPSIWERSGFVQEVHIILWRSGTAREGDVTLSYAGMA